MRDIDIYIDENETQLFNYLLCAKCVLALYIVLPFNLDGIRRFMSLGNCTKMFDILLSRRVSCIIKTVKVV